MRYLTFVILVLVCLQTISSQDSKNNSLQFLQDPNQVLFNDISNIFKNIDLVKSILVLNSLNAYVKDKLNKTESVEKFLNIAKDDGLQALIHELTKPKVNNQNISPKLLSAGSDWTISALGSVNGGGTGKEFTENLYTDDENDWSKWYDGNSSETWIKANFSSPKIITQIALKSANDVPKRDPYKIVIYDENNKIIETLDKIVFSKRHETKTFKINCERAVSSLKLVIVQNYEFSISGGFGSGTQLAQVKFYE